MLLYFCIFCRLRVIDKRLRQTPSLFSLNGDFYTVKSYLTKEVSLLQMISVGMVMQSEI